MSCETVELLVQPTTWICKSVLGWLLCIEFSMTANGSDFHPTRPLLVIQELTCIIHVHAPVFAGPLLLCYAERCCWQRLVFAQRGESCGSTPAHRVHRLGAHRLAGSDKRPRCDSPLRLFAFSTPRTRGSLTVATDGICRTGCARLYRCT